MVIVNAVLDESWRTVHLPPTKVGERLAISSGRNLRRFLEFYYEATSYLITSYSLNPVQQDSSERAISSNTICGVSMIFICICLVLWPVYRKKRRIHRATVLRKQVETLEKLWQLDFKN